MFSHVWKQVATRSFDLSWIPSPAATSENSQRRVDPEGSIMRRLQAVNRRRYQVPSPRSLWHMDGNHKLRCALANGY